MRRPLGVFKMRWWTPDPHPCLGGCGTIPPTSRGRSDVPSASGLMRRRRRRSDTESEAREGFASSAGKSRLSKGEGSARSIGSGRGSTSGSRRRRSGGGSGGIGSSSIARSAASLLRKNGNVKYCRPCSVDRNGAGHHRRRFARRKERGLCVEPSLPTYVRHGARKELE